MTEVIMDYRVCACVCVVHETLGERDAEAYLIWVMIQSVARELGYQKEEQPLCWSCRAVDLYMMEEVSVSVVVSLQYF